MLYYSFCGSNASCTSDSNAISSVPPTGSSPFGSAVVPPDGGSGSLDPLHALAVSASTRTNATSHRGLLCVPSSFGPRTSSRRAPRPLSEVPTAGLFHQRFRLLPEPSGILLPVHQAPVLRRTHAGVESERGDEMRQRVEAGPVTDLRHGQGRVAEQFARVVDPESDQVPVRRHAEPLLEDPREVEGGERGRACDGVHVQVLSEVLLEIGAHLLGALPHVPALPVLVSEDPEQGEPPSRRYLRTRRRCASFGFLPFRKSSHGPVPGRMPSGVPERPIDLVGAAP